MNSKVVWAGGAFAIFTNALSIVKLTNHILKVGLVGVPAYVVESYSAFVLEVRHWLVEIPFHITPPEWVMHLVIVWSLFCGSNYRFLAYDGRGQRLIRGFGDVGRGIKKPLSPRATRLANIGLSASGPVFALFVLLMWLGNRRMGPTGLGHWGDRFMIGNRIYTLRLSRLYLLILSLSPIAAALLIAWGAASNLSQ